MAISNINEVKVEKKKVNKNEAVKVTFVNQRGRAEELFRAKIQTSGIFFRPIN